LITGNLFIPLHALHAWNAWNADMKHKISTNESTCRAWVHPQPAHTQLPAIACGHSLANDDDWRLSDHEPFQLDCFAILLPTPDTDSRTMATWDE
jgi:hypothetical protein